MKILFGAILLFQSMSFSYSADPIHDTDSAENLKRVNRLVVAATQNILKDLGILTSIFMDEWEVQELLSAGSGSGSGAGSAGDDLEGYVALPSLGLTLSRLQAYFGEGPATALFLTELNKLRMVSSKGTVAYVQLLKFLEPEETKDVFSRGLDQALLSIKKEDEIITRYLSSLTPTLTVGRAAEYNSIVQKALIESGLNEGQIEELLRFTSCEERREHLLSMGTEASAYAYARAATGLLNQPNFHKNTRTPFPADNQALTFFFGISDLAVPGETLEEQTFFTCKNFVGDNILFLNEEINFEATKGALMPYSVDISQTLRHEFPIGEIYKERIAEVARMGVAFPSPRIHELVAAILPWWNDFCILERKREGQQRTIESDRPRTEREIERLTAEASGGVRSEDLEAFLLRVQKTELRHTVERHALIKSFDERFDREYKDQAKRNTDLLLGLLYPLLCTFDS